MQGTAIPIFLQHEHARPFCELGVVLDGFGIPNPVNQVSNQYSIGGELIISMLRDSDVAPANKSNDLLESSHGDRLPKKVIRCKSAIGPRAANQERGAMTWLRPVRPMSTN